MTHLTPSCARVAFIPLSLQKRYFQLTKDALEIKINRLEGLRQRKFQEIIALMSAMNLNRPQGIASPPLSGEMPAAGGCSSGLPHSTAAAPQAHTSTSNVAPRASPSASTFSGRPPSGGVTNHLPLTSTANRVEAAASRERAGVRLRVSPPKRPRTRQGLGKNGDGC